MYSTVVFEGYPAFYAHAFIKSQVRLIGDAIRGGCVYNSFVECKDRVFFLQQVSGDFLDVGIQPYTQEGLFALDVFKEFLFVHIGMFLNLFLIKEISLERQVCIFYVCFVIV